MRRIVPEPLTADAFAPFGDVIEATDEAEVMPINQGWTTRFNALADVAVGDGRAIISIFRSRPLTPPVLKVFERH
ncbi:MAG: ureidoglycolate lyase, partial [Tabrizicola sp.]|nr:ureidoglycolate lyase [Tabrizicola sp.]